MVLRLNFDFGRGLVVIACCVVEAMAYASGWVTAAWKKCDERDELSDSGNSASYMQSRFFASRLLVSVGILSTALSIDVTDSSLCDGKGCASLWRCLGSLSGMAYTLPIRSRSVVCYYDSRIHACETRLFQRAVRGSDPVAS